MDRSVSDGPRHDTASTREPESLPAALEHAGDLDSGSSARPTLDVYGSFERAFVHFNAALFGNKLPPTLFSLSRKAHTPGHYLPARWVSTGDEAQFAAEIVLNPAYITTRPIRSSLAELVHQMVHHAQATFGKPGRGSYHNKQFADWMNSVGLVTTSDGSLAGSVLGPTITQRIVRGEAFDIAADALLASDYSLAWLDRHPPEEGDLPPELTERVTRAEVEAARAESAVAAGSRVDSAAPSPTVSDGSVIHSQPIADSTAAETTSGSVPGLLDDLDGLPAASGSPASASNLDATDDDAEGLDAEREPSACSAVQDRIQPMKRAPAGKNKIKYQCEKCGDAVWGKPGIDAQCRKDAGRFVDVRAGDSVDGADPAVASTSPAANEDASAADAAA